MQVTTTQTSQALVALRSHRRRIASRRRRSRPVHRVAPTTVGRALTHIAGLPRVRAAHVAAARGRVLAGQHPSAAQVADMLVRRSVCDLLR